MLAIIHLPETWGILCGFRLAIQLLVFQPYVNEFFGLISREFTINDAITKNASAKTTMESGALRLPSFLRFLSRYLTTKNVRAPAW
jgi:hypothetical protein